MKKKREVLSIMVLVVSSIVTMAFVLPQDQNTVKPKEIPKEYKTMANPYKGDASLNMVGLRNYNRHCVSCHGKKGLGDGAMSKNLKTFPGNLTTAEFNKHTDGEIYFLSFIGVTEKPDFIKLIPNEEDRWAVVNYVRTLITE